MNIQHLKYAVEVEKTGSISQAAQQLFMGQPNLSKAIRELERDLGITIFRRTSKGVVPTVAGREFLEYAKSILAQVAQVESLYRPGGKMSQSFRISVPRTSYVAYVFTEFVDALSKDGEMNLSYRETDSMRAIRNVAEGEDTMGIIRYQTIYEDYFLKYMAERALKHIEIMEFEYAVMISEQSQLAKKDTLEYEDLSGYIEILQGDLSVPYISVDELKKKQAAGKKKRIYVYERGSQFDLLSRLPGTYMWCSPMPKDVLSRNALVLRPCRVADHRYKDVLIYPAGYMLNGLDRLFMEKLDVINSYAMEDSGIISKL